MGDLAGIRVAVQAAVGRLNGAEHLPLIRRTVVATARVFDARLSPEDVEDLAQETLLALWRKSSSKTIECVWAYAQKSARNITIDGLRRRSAEKRGSGQTVSLEELRAVAGTTPSFEGAVLARDELDALVKSWCLELPRLSFRVLYLRVVHGLSTKEIGEVLGLSASAVDSHAYRARRTLGLSSRKC